MKNLLGLNEDYQLDLKSSKKLSEEHVLEIDTKSEEDLELMEDNTDSDDGEDEGPASSSKKPEETKPENKDPDDAEGDGSSTSNDSKNDELDNAENTGPQTSSNKSTVRFSMNLGNDFDKRVMEAKTLVDVVTVLKDFLTKLSTEAKAAV